MGEWTSVKLKDVSRVVTGKTPSIKNPEDFGFEVPFVTPTDYRNYGKWASRAERNLSKLGTSRLNGKVLPEKSILVTCIGSDMGKVVMNRVHVITNQQINALIPNPKIVDPDFVYYLLKHNYPLLRSYGESGTAVPILNKRDFEELEFEFPSLLEQRTIAEVLSSLDDKIDLLHRQNKTLESLAETLFRQWFIEEADDSWESGVITDLVELNPKRILPKGTIAPYLEMSNLSNSLYHPTNWYDRMFNSGTKFINGDTLLARITPCLENGKTGFVDFLAKEQVGWGSTEFIVMRAKEPLHPFFSYILARYDSFRDFAIGCMVGSSGRQRADIDNLATYEMKIPPMRVMSCFNLYIEPSLQKMKLNNKQTRDLILLRDILLPKLISGEILLK